MLKSAARNERFMTEVVMVVISDKGFEVAEGAKVSTVDVDRLIKTAREIVSQYL